MLLKDVCCGYRNVHVFVDEGRNFFTLPQKMKMEDAVARYGEREVFYLEDHDDLEYTEVVVETDQQFRDRTKNT